MSQTSLPITQFKEIIQGAIWNYSLVIVTGETGSGKSTQVPQYILDMEPKAKIIVTQPRRVSAMSLSGYISKNFPKGDVGYMIGGKKNPGKRINFVTTGVLKNMLIHDNTSFTHVVIDEVHERDLDIDFCLFLLKMLRIKKSKIKIILMSATIQSENFAKYFAAEEDIPIIQVPVRTFPVEEFFLEDICKLTKRKIQDIKDRNLPRLSDFKLELLKKLLLWIHENYDPGASVLIFLSGLHGIISMENLLSHCNEFEVIPIHSMVPIEQQHLMFQPVIGKRKIILATNIAESSITVPDLHIIVDTCTEKRIEWKLGCETLVEDFISLESAEQRKGRAGRTHAGVIFRFIEKSRFQSLNITSSPEMLRVSLHRLVLGVLLLNIGSPYEVLKQTIDPPEIKMLDVAYEELLVVGAIRMIDGEVSLTPIGIILATLPLEVSPALLVMYGNIFNYTYESVAMAAIISIGQNFVKYDATNVLNEYETLLEWSHGTKSDLIANYLIFEAYMCEVSGKNLSSQKKWAKRNGIDLRRIHSCLVKIDEIYDHLSKYGSKPPKYIPRRKNHSKESPGGLTEEDFLNLKFLLSGALHMTMCQMDLEERNSLQRNEIEIQTKGTPDTAKISKFFKSWNIAITDPTKIKGNKLTVADSKPGEESLLAYYCSQFSQHNLKKQKVLDIKDVRTELPFQKIHSKFLTKSSPSLIFERKGKKFNLHVATRSCIQPLNTEYRKKEKFITETEKMEHSFVAGRILIIESKITLLTLLTQLPHIKNIRDAILFVFSPQLNRINVGPQVPPIIQVTGYNYPYAFFSVLDKELLNSIIYLRDYLLQSFTTQHINQEKASEGLKMLQIFCFSYGKRVANIMENNFEQQKKLFANIRSIPEVSPPEAKLLSFILDSKVRSQIFNGAIVHEIKSILRENPKSNLFSSWISEDALFVFKKSTPDQAFINTLFRSMGIICRNVIPNQVLNNLKPKKLQKGRYDKQLDEPVHELSLPSSQQAQLKQLFSSFHPVISTLILSNQRKMTIPHSEYEDILSSLVDAFQLTSKTKRNKYVIKKPKGYSSIDLLDAIEMHLANPMIGLKKPFKKLQTFLLKTLLKLDIPDLPEVSDEQDYDYELSSDESSYDTDETSNDDELFSTKKLSHDMITELINDSLA